MKTREILRKLCNFTARQLAVWNRAKGELQTRFQEGYLFSDVVPDNESDNSLRGSHSMEIDVGESSMGSEKKNDIRVFCEFMKMKVSPVTEFLFYIFIFTFGLVLNIVMYNNVPR